MRVQALIDLPNEYLLSLNGKKTATYCFKAQTNVDEDGFVKKLTYTTGSVHDAQEFERLLTHDEQVVYADKAYDSKKHRQLLENYGIENKIQRRAARRHPLTPAQVLANKRYGSLSGRARLCSAEITPWRGESALLGHTPK